MNFTESGKFGHSIDDNFPKLSKLSHQLEETDPLEDLERIAIGNLLPDDEDELLAGIMDSLDIGGLPIQLDDTEEYDLFGSGGGMELDYDPQDGSTIGLSKISLSDGFSNGFGQYALTNGSGTVAGEHPYGEHPSRTLFVRNINSNIEDSELRSLFEVTAYLCRSVSSHTVPFYHQIIISKSLLAFLSYCGISNLSSGYLH